MASWLQFADDWSCELSEGTFGFSCILDFVIIIVTCVGCDVITRCVCDWLRPGRTRVRRAAGVTHTDDARDVSAVTSSEKERLKHIHLDSYSVCTLKFWIKFE